MMSTNSPSIFTKMNLSSCVLVLRYAPGTSKTDTYLLLCTSIMSMVYRVSRETVGDDASSLVLYHLCGPLSLHVIPFVFPILFYFIRFIVRSYPFLYDLVCLLGSSSPITFMYSNFVYYLYMTDTSLSTCFILPFLAVICMNVTSTASLWMSCIKYYLFVSVLVNWVSYFFPPNFIFRFSTPSPFFPLLAFCSCFHAS